MICCTATLPLLAPKLEAGDIHKEPTPGHTPPNIHAIAGAGNVSELQKAANSQTADFSAADHLGLTPLMWAASSGEINAVIFLLKNGVSVNEKARSKSGETALHFACNNGHYRLVKLLLDIGADVNATDSLSGTPLIYAANCGHANVVQSLLGM